MGREFELKFRATPQQMDAIRADFEGFREITMETTYFDTPDCGLGARRWTLRQRMENGTAVCALKTPGNDGGCGEWETECSDISAAIPALCALGAPQELQELTAAGLEAICSARFIRLAATIQAEGCTLELALDRGILRGGARIALLGEVEVELKEGSEEAAIAFARNLAQTYRLRQEMASKYARALALTGRI